MQLGQLKPKFDKFIDLINTSYWFIPMMSILLVLGLLWLTHIFDQAQALHDWPLVDYLYNIDPIGVRSILSTIAGAVITVTSIAFSMIVVSLTLASSQFGPRLLRTFMQDKKTQFPLGIFVATFIYCLALLRFINLDTDTPFVPGLGLAFALLLALTSILVLVFLIHHVATSIQPESVIEMCWRSFQDTVDKMYLSSPTSTPPPEPKDTLTRLRGLTPIEIKSDADGFVQIIDYNGLLLKLEHCSASLEFHIKPGDYTIRGEKIAVIYCEKNNDKVKKFTRALHQYIVLGSIRTPIQDPQFGINQMVEITLRALSPSINDPFTATTCIFKLGSALSLLAGKTFPETVVRNSNHANVLIRKIPQFSNLVNTACNQIRQECLNHPSVVISLLKMLRQVALSTKKSEYQKPLIEQGQKLLEQVRSTQLHEADLACIESQYLHLKYLN